MKQVNKIIEGVIWQQVLLFFLPIVISAFFQHFYTIVDGIIIGQALGDVAFSAVGGSASKISVMLINFFLGVSSGITAYASRYYGKRDMVAVKQTVFNGSFIFILLGLSLSVIGFLVSPALLIAMKTPELTLEYANIYLRTFLCGLVFCVIYNTFSGILRAIGDAKTPLYILIFCSITNIILDLLFVVVFSFGVFGVALATLIAQAVSALIAGIILTKKLPQTNSKATIDTKMIKDICKIGIPAGVQSMMYSFSNILVQSAINGFGHISVAAWAAYVKIDNIVDVFVSALSSTVITFVGQNYGAGKLDRVKKAVYQIIILSYIITGSLVIIFMLFRIQLLSLFTTNIQVAELGANLFFVIMPMYLLGIPYQICVQALRGIGKSFIPMIITLVGIVGIRVLWVTVAFPLSPTIQFLGLCYPISSTIMSIIFVVYYRLELKKL